MITWRSSGCAIDLAIWIFHFANMDWAIIFQEPCIWFFQDPRVQKHNLMGFILMATEWDSWSVSWARCRAFLELYAVCSWSLICRAFLEADGSWRPMCPAMRVDFLRRVEMSDFLGLAAVVLVRSVSDSIELLHSWSPDLARFLVRSESDSIELRGLRVSILIFSRFLMRSESDSIELRGLGSRS